MIACSHAKFNFPALTTTCPGPLCLVLSVVLIPETRQVFHAFRRPRSRRTTVTGPPCYSGLPTCLCFYLRWVGPFVITQRKETRSGYRDLSDVSKELARPRTVTNSEEGHLRKAASGGSEKVVRRGTDVIVKCTGVAVFRARQLQVLPSRPPAMH